MHVLWMTRVRLFVGAAALLACVASASALAAVRDSGGKAQPPGTTLSAAVDGLGVLLGGSAKSATRFELGTYQVTFGKNISACVAVAAPGRVGVSGSDVFDAIGSVTVAGQGGGKTIDVVFHRNGGFPTDTDFMLIVAC